MVLETPPPAVPALEPPGLTDTREAAAHWTLTGQIPTSTSTAQRPAVTGQGHVPAIGALGEPPK